MDETKQINIFIEGFNDSGICVGCLNYNRKMYYCDDVKKYFKLLGSIEIPDGMLVRLCWECLAEAHKVRTFQDKIIKSYNVLLDYSSTHTFLDSPQDLSKHAKEKLTIKPPETTSYIDGVDVVEISPQVKIEIEMLPFKLDENIEEDIVANINDLVPESPLPDIPDLEDTSDIFCDPLFKEESDNDNGGNAETEHLVENSDKEDRREEKKRSKKEKSEKKSSLHRKLKEDRKSHRRRSKEGKRDKERKNARATAKLKMFPPDTVDICIMTEEQMWLVRRQDSLNETYLKLRYKCDLCLTQFHSAKAKDFHMSSKHPKKSTKESMCDVCHTEFQSKTSIPAHRTLHLEAYRCRLCPLVTTMKSIMLAHVPIHNMMYACNKCSAEFSCTKKMAYHKLYCNKVRPQCDCCGKSFFNKNNLIQHLKGLAMKGKPKKKLNLKCEHCERLFDTKDSLRVHSKVHENLLHPCPLCGKLFRWRTSVDRHLQTHADKAAGKTYVCQHCHKVFTNMASHKFHIKHDHGSPDGKPYCEFQCDYCGKKYRGKTNLIDHIDWVHLMKIKYQCSICQKAFKSALNMNIHISNIHDKGDRKKYLRKKYSYPFNTKNLCDICGRSFTCKAVLEDHKHAHSGVASFACETCGRMFMTQRHLKQHAYRHSGKTYPCPICGRSFNSPSNRDRHRSVHKHVRDVKCEHCEKYFKSKAERNVHIKHVHLKKPWPKRVRANPNE